jgi:hypothetical protein
VTKTPPPVCEVCGDEAVGMYIERDEDMYMLVCETHGRALDAARRRRLMHAISGRKEN